MTEWTPFRPTDQDIYRMTTDVCDIPEIQQKLLSKHPRLSVADRVAHQYQIAGGRVELTIAASLPENLTGVGLFEPGARHIGIGRVSTGLGCPHLETDPDFLGLMLAFQAKAGQRVDFLGINSPGAPTDDHKQFMALLDATADAAGAEPPFGSGRGQLDLFDLLASNLKMVRSLVSGLGFKHGGGIAMHALRQTLRTATSATAYQSYWTGIVETGGVPGKFVITPRTDENTRRSLRPGEHYLTDDWRARQAQDSIRFDIFWLPFIDQNVTDLNDLTEVWEEQRQRVGEVNFPKADGQSDNYRAWEMLAAEMGANPGNWVRDRENTIGEPGTEYTCARKIAYESSQAGRDVLSEHVYAHVFEDGRISDELLAELKSRRAKKQQASHIDTA